MPFWMSQETLTAFDWVLRAAVTFAVLFIITKLMGQRQLGELHLFDFIIAITIGSIAANPLTSAEDGLDGALITMTFYGVAAGLIVYLSVKFPKLGRVMEDEPIVLVQNGRILQDILQKTRLSIGDLLSELRLNGYPNPHDVEFAILEPSGRVSVIPKSQARPLRPKDLDVPTGYEGMPTVIIQDGQVNTDNLGRIGLDRQWVDRSLEDQGIYSPAGVLLAVLDTQGRLYVAEKGADYEEIRAPRNGRAVGPPARP